MRGAARSRSARLRSHGADPSEPVCVAGRRQDLLVRPGAGTWQRLQRRVPCSRDGRDSVRLPARLLRRLRGARWEVSRAVLCRRPAADRDYINRLPTITRPSSLHASPRAGNSLVGGENGVLGTISHIYYIPLNAAAFGVKQAVCQERDNSTVVYSVAQGRIGAAVPPPAQPPPAAHVAAAKDAAALGSGGLASVSTAALVHPVSTTGFATAGGGAAAAGSSSGSLPQLQPHAAVPPQSTGPAKELIPPPPPPPKKAAVNNNPLTGGWMANPFIGG